MCNLCAEFYPHVKCRFIKVQNKHLMHLLTSFNFFRIVYEIPSTAHRNLVVCFIRNLFEEFSNNLMSKQASEQANNEYYYM